jgi:hypothetical protein
MFMEFLVVIFVIAFFLRKPIKHFYMKYKIMNDLNSGDYKYQIIPFIDSQMKPPAPADEWVFGYISAFSKHYIMAKNIYYDNQGLIKFYYPTSKALFNETIESILSYYYSEEDKESLMLKYTQLDNRSKDLKELDIFIDGEDSGGADAIQLERHKLTPSGLSQHLHS